MRGGEQATNARPLSSLNPSCMIRHAQAHPTQHRCHRSMCVYDTPRTIAQILTMLAATPAHLADLTAALPPAHLLAPPAPGAWSARDVLAHLRACPDIWGTYIVQI